MVNVNRMPSLHCWQVFTSQATDEVLAQTSSPLLTFQNSIDK